MLQWANEKHLWALLISLILIAAFIYQEIWRKNGLITWGKSNLLKAMMPSYSPFKKKLRFILPLIGFMSLVIAWANPLVGTKYETVKRKGIDVIFAIDISKSMEAEDVVPNRIRKAKQIISNTIDVMSNDRIGIIVFAGNAYLQMPVTVDYSGALMYLKTINTNMTAKQGTAIADAIDLAMQSFDDESEGFKTLVILSDGEDHDGNAISAAKLAAENGITIHTIGVGSDQAVPIPIDNKGSYKTSNGEIIKTQLNEEMLKDLAIAGKGKYLQADEVTISEQLNDLLNLKEGREIEEKVITSYKNQFPWFLGIAFVLLFIDLLIKEKKWSWFSK